MNATTAPGEVAERCIFINFDISSYYFNDNLTLKIVFVNHLIFCVINAVMSASTICLNSITAITYWKSIQLKKKMANFLIMLLSLSDLGIGMICNPFFVALLAREISTKKPSCFLNGLNLWLYLVFTGWSFMTLIVLNFERYLSILHPLSHRKIINKRRLITKCLVILWFLAGAQVAFTFYSQDVMIVVLIVEVVLLIPVLAFIYVKIYFACRTILSRNASRTNISINSNASSQVQNLWTQLERERHVRLVKCCSIVLVCFCISYMPSCVLVAIRKDNYVTDMAYIWSETLLLLNSSLNSLIFFWGNRRLRKEALRILAQTFCKQ